MPSFLSRIAWFSTSWASLWGIVTRTHAELGLDDPVVLHSAPEEALHGDEPGAHQEAQEEEQGHQHLLLGGDGFGGGHRLVDHAGIAHFARKGVLQALDVVQQGGIQFRLDLHIAGQPHHLLLRLRQCPQFVVDLVRFRLELGDLVIQGRHDVGVLVVGPEELRLLLLEGRDLRTQAGALLEIDAPLPGPCPRIRTGCGTG